MPYWPRLWQGSTFNLQNTATTGEAQSRNWGYSAAILAGRDAILVARANMVKGPGAQSTQGTTVSVRGHFLLMGKMSYVKPFKRGPQAGL